MKKITLFILLLIGSTNLFAQQFFFKGKFVISKLVRYENGVIVKSTDVSSLDECPYYFEFFDTGKFILSEYEDDECAVETRSEGKYRVYKNVLTIDLEGDLETYQIDLRNADKLILSVEDSTPGGIGFSQGTIKNQYHFQKLKR